MKILAVIPALGSIYGGPSQCVCELARALAQLGVGIDLVATNANGSTSLDVPLHTWMSEKSYRIQYFSYWGWNDYKLSGSLSRWLFQHVTDYDLVQINAIFSLTNLPAYWACRSRHIPYVIVPHGMLEPWALSYKAWKKRIYYDLLEKPALNRASVIQSLASTEAKGIQSLNLNAPIVVIPNGIHRADFECLPNPDVFYQKFPETHDRTLILFLGRIDPKKGLDLLAPAFAKARSQFPQTHLIIAGPDNIGFLPTVHNYFSEAGCLDAVTFTGMLTGELKYSALAAAQIYVAPSYSEGFSMSVLEGMAAGLPCIITTGCNFPEAAATQTAEVVEIDSEAIAEALLRCLNDPQQAQTMGDRARQFIIENYTWNSIAVKLLEVYTAILDRKPLSDLSLDSQEL
jgi:glycosyltransferase involved in cell wall biosynthesis